MATRTRRDFLKEAAMGTMSAVGAAALARPEAARAGEAAPRPNFVFFLCDDLGWADIGCFGSPFYDTPNIDRLAAGGTRFLAGYAASPVCSPTRASIMTGKNPARLHLTNYLVGNRWPKNPTILPVPWQHFLPLEEVTIAEALKEAGYATGYVGKWHLGNEPYTPEAQGFDVNVGGCHMGAPPTYFDPYRIPKLPDRRAGEYLTDRLADEAVRFIGGHKDRPFFLYVAHYAVHIPLMAKEDHKTKYAAKAAGLPADRVAFGQEGQHKLRVLQDHPVYAGMVESVDDSVGRVMKALEDAGVADRTVIFFMSDNGGLSTAEGWPTANLPLRAGKGWLYEGGLREPLIIRWPGVARPGTVCDTPVVSDDFYPTILAMAGLPLRPQQHQDGTSLVPLLRDGAAPPRDALCWHYPHYSNQGGTPGSAIREGDWKLIEFFDSGRAELYNLRDDLGEKNDLAAKMPDRVAALRRRLAEWRDRVGAQVPAPNPDYRPA